MNGWFDTHAHLDDPRFDGDREDLLARMSRQGVALCLTVGSTVEASRQAADMAARYGYLYAAAGVHPHEADCWNPQAREALLDLIRQPKVVAWGEIGLDYHYDFSPRPVQRAVFTEQMDLARGAGLPVLIHVREAWGDLLSIIRGRQIHGVVHCWSGSVESARLCLDAGLHISFAGPVTFRKSVHLHEAARYVPADRLLVETDCPYLAPEPVRGKRNDPRNVGYILASLAALRGEDAGELTRRTLLNGCRLFAIDPPEREGDAGRTIP